MHHSTDTSNGALRVNRARFVFALLILLVSTNLWGQSTDAVYVLRFDSVFDPAFSSSSPKVAVGSGTRFIFVYVTDERYIIQFQEITPVPADNQDELKKNNQDLKFLEERDSQPYKSEPSKLHKYMYHEIGLRFTGGTLAVPYKYLFSGRMVSGGTIGGYLGGQYSINHSIAFVLAGSVGLGHVTDNEGQYPTLTLAGFIGGRVGPTIQAGVILGTDLAPDYSDHGEFWISGAIGVEFF